jgi:hypothetical protein
VTDIQSRLNPKSGLIRQFVTIIGITGNIEYSADDLPSYMSSNGSTVYTITLPTAASIGSGFICTIINISINSELWVGCTSNFRYNSEPWPNPNGTDISSTATLKLRPCQTVRLISNPSVWSVI